MTTAFEGNRSRLIAGALGLALVLMGCGGDDAGEGDGGQAGGDAGQTTVTATGTLDAEDQSTDGSSLTVASVSIDSAPGWIAIHTDQDGQPGPVIGAASIPEGDSTDVTVEFDQPLEKTAELWPMLHIDDGEVGTYEFTEVEGTDLPVLEDDMPVMEQISVKVK